MTKTEMTEDGLMETMELLKKLHEVLNGHSLHLGLSALTLTMAYLIVVNENIAPVDKVATVADTHLREAIDMLKISGANYATH
jgi:hypothetical protein